MIQSQITMGLLLVGVIVYTIWSAFRDENKVYKK